MISKLTHCHLYRKIPPPANLNPENARIWAGWNELGNKEIAREASAKGFYVNLAIRFIAARTGVELEEAEKCFQDEVLKWFRELLARKQIHRASHILNNINLDAFQELTRIFCETEDRNMRDYIGDHLLKNGKLDEPLKNSWVLLNGILADENLFLSFTEKNCSLNINRILKLDCDFKSKIAVSLYFKSFDVQLEPLLNAECLWSFLLVSNRIELIKLWIKVQFSQKQSDSDITYKADILEGMLKLFRQFHITDTLIDSMLERNRNIPLETQNIILKELSKYGVFSSVDSSHILCLLRRLQSTGNVVKYKQILQSDSASIKVETFHDLLINHCLNCDLIGVINLCSLDNKEANVLSLLKPKCNELSELMYSIYETVEKTDDCKALQINLLKVSQYLNPDALSYFKTCPIMLVLLVLLDSSLDFCSLIENSKDSIVIDNVEINLDVLFSLLPSLRTIRDKYQKRIAISSVTIWQLLVDHTDLNTNSLTDFVNLVGSVPHFNCHSLVHQYGCKKTIDFSHFLKQCQPSQACRMLLIDNMKSQETDKTNACLKAENMAIKNFLDSGFTAAVVAFLEMLGESSKRLRIHLDAIKIVSKDSISRFFEINDIVTQFLRYTDNSKVIADTLESILIKNMRSLDARKNFVHMLRQYQIVIKFCVLHNLNLPEGLLNLFAVNNLWLPFLICAQMYNYPLQQIRKLVQNFKNPHLLEHVNHSVLHNIDIDAFMRKKDTRTRLYAKIGIHPGLKKPADEPMHGSTSSLSSHESVGGASSDSLDPAEADVLDMKATLLQTLIRCHNSGDPPRAFLQAAQHYRNPLLAILATSYEPDSIVINWLVWLGVSCDMCDSMFDYDSLSLCPHSVLDFLKRVIEQNYVRTLLESFEIFLPENPLRCFVAFLNECVHFNFDGDIVKENMAAFHRSIKYIRSNSLISETDYEITYLKNRMWIQRAALVLAASVLEYSFTSRVDQIRFARILCELDADTILNFAQYFENVVVILKGLHKHGCTERLNFSKIYDDKEYQSVVRNYLNILIKKEEFEEAIAIAEMENISKDEILIEQFRTLLPARTDETFWRTCSDAFHKHHCAPETIVHFFLEHSENLDSDSYERYVVLKLAYEWARQSSLTDVYEVEKEMWKSYISLDVKDKSREMEETTCKRSYAEMKDELKGVKEATDPYVSTAGFTENLCSTIDVLLRFGYFWEALKVAKMFAFKHNDLEILKLCASVAEGLLLTTQFNKDQRLLLNSGAEYNYRTKSLWTSKVSGISSISSSVCTIPEIDTVDQISKDNVIALQRLVGNLNNGFKIGQNILMMYRISINLDIPYNVLLESDDDFQLLKDALDDSSKAKLELVHDFVTVYKWSKPKITDFLCEELINTINAYIKSKSANLILWDINLDTEFLLILQLLHENCSLLGMKLYTYSNALHMSQSLRTREFRISEIALIVELLIRAHDCFTADCNMEGITLILKKCQTIIALLLQLKSWKWIVRLLTGIGRYTEMEYVFKILKENDQFEFLLRKGSQRDNGLKSALLEYLKKFCPDNKELYRMVALHFTLFSEVANLWELEADGIVKNLIIISKLEMENNSMNPAQEPFVLFTATDGTKICLHKAMVNYNHATQYHLQGEKLLKAMNSARQAELIALQLSRLKKLGSYGTTICLLHLNPLQINTLLAKHLSFPQALILIEAYNYKPDWATVLHEQCVVRGHMDYLQKFTHHFHLSDSLVHDISRKFLNIRPSTKNVDRMKQILVQLPSIHMKYKIASELGFLDIVEDLLAEDKLAYLKDTVWKKGYRN